ncbi:hypothetical protein FPZ43_00575 [Mucilaginibacter pallidiroseus]|uniref:Uncharacterized protein n=1 Tax=Mucilaginibacter pallidiroseus TaxID=2599295 RepID=A0A563UI91_9SPHI|nr:hypothetical protein FPZ43_00575 [Mucilaginibacter pallidiroseus]
MCRASARAVILVNINTFCRTERVASYNSIAAKPFVTAISGAIGTKISVGTGAVNRNHVTTIQPVITVTRGQRIAKHPLATIQVNKLAAGGIVITFYIR